MNRFFDEGLGLLAIGLLLPIMLLVVWPATFLFDVHIGVFRRG